MHSTYSLSVDPVPLVVVVDHALLRSSLLSETRFAQAGQSIPDLLRILRATVPGRGGRSTARADRRGLDPSHLPYNDHVLGLIAHAKSQGRPVHLMSSAPAEDVSAVARFLQVSDTVFAATDAAATTSRRLVEAFGHGGFDLVGRDGSDPRVWTASRRYYCVEASRPIHDEARTAGVDLHPVGPAAAIAWGTWLRAFRVHQYAKNTLIFVPLLTSHSFNVAAFAESFAAFATFSLAASAVYVLNDLVDVEADRRHPTKRLRPFASGELAMEAGFRSALALFLVATVAAALLLPPSYVLVVYAYLVLTTSYTLFIKRKMLIDIVVLAMLYTIRIVAGAFAIDVALSEWLMTFSFFVFTSLALIKRYTELTIRLDRGLGDATNRNYRQSDLELIGALAAATATNAVTVFAIYLSSPAVTAVYTRPKLLWTICPILLYALGRMLLMAHRRLMHDDPVTFALRDRNSRLAVTLVVAIVLLAA